ICGMELIERSSNEGADAFAADRRDDRTRTVNVENDQRQGVFAAERDRGLVDDLELFHDHVPESDFVVELGGRILFRVGGIDALDARRLDDDVRLDLNGPQYRRGVGGEVWIAGAGGEDDGTPFLEMAHGAAADVRLG